MQKEAAEQHAEKSQIAAMSHSNLAITRFQKYAPPEGYDSAWTFLDALCEKGFKEKIYGQSGVR